MGELIIIILLVPFGVWEEKPFVWMVVIFGNG